MKPTQQEIIELAREAGFGIGQGISAIRINGYADDLLRLAELLLERFGAGGGGGESLTTFTAEGEHSLKSGNHYLDLVEYHPAQDWPVNHPIWVRYFDSDVWYPRHFAKYEDGCVYTWKDGGTSHTTHDTTCWSQGTDVNPNQEK